MQVTKYVISNRNNLSSNYVNIRPNETIKTLSEITIKITMIRTLVIVIKILINMLNNINSYDTNHNIYNNNNSN